jgi:lipopolysaccharide biosynthesis protein
MKAFLKQLIHRRRLTKKIYTSKSEKYFISQPKKIYSNSKVAVVVHLYFTESWNYFKQKLELLSSSTEFDLFVTMPKSNSDFSSVIYTSFPNANIYIVPNRGRDVLPFIKICQILSSLGYLSLLKIHSKKSTHRNDGNEWLNDTIERLIPNSQLLNSIVDAIRSENFGVVGPKEYYYPVAINYEANFMHITRLFKYLQINNLEQESIRWNYGFFGGTMFWINVASISPLFNISKRNFEKEEGQIDGTFAHGLERIFCILPESKNRVLWTSSEDSTFEKLNTYKSENIPEWSDLFN